MKKRLPVETTRHAFAYIFEGEGVFRDASDPRAVKTELDEGVEVYSTIGEAGNRTMVLFDQGDEVVVQAGERGVRFLLVSGRPLEEPVAWHGPIVMNTPEQSIFAKPDVWWCSGSPGGIGSPGYR